MKVYQIHYHHGDHGMLLEWASSKREAERMLREAKKRDDRVGEPSGITPMDIPTTKAGLIHWLNVYVNVESENG